MRTRAHAPSRWRRRGVFIDGEGTVGEEHPPGDVQKGEAFVRKVMTASFKGPHWPHMAIFLAYDEGGGFFDHVSPPAACVPSKDAANAGFDRLGIRLPLVVVSPYARRLRLARAAGDHVDYALHRARPRPAGADAGATPTRRRCSTSSPSPRRTRRRRRRPRPVPGVPVVTLRAAK